MERFTGKVAKMLFAVAAVCVLAVSLVACAQGSASASKSSVSASSGSAAASSASASSSVASAASASAPLDGPVKVMALNGPTGIGMAQLSENTQAYDVRFVGATDEVVSSLASGSVDIAAVPTNLASVLYNRTQGGVTMVAVDTFGTLYLLSADPSVTSIADLRGHAVKATGQGANPQYILEHLIAQEGLSLDEDVSVEYLAEHAELAALASKGEVDVALLPQPFVAVAQNNNADLNVAVDMGQAWKQATGSDLAMGCVVVRTEFLEQHPEAVAAFLADLEASVNFAATDTQGAAQLCVDKGILPNVQVATAAIPNCSLVFVTGADMRSAVEGYLSVLFDANAASVGGALPGDDFYFMP